MSQQRMFCLTSLKFWLASYLSRIKILFKKRIVFEKGKQIMAVEFFFTWKLLFFLLRFIVNHMKHNKKKITDG